MVNLTLAIMCSTTIINISVISFMASLIFQRHATTSKNLCTSWKHSFQLVCCIISSPSLLYTLIIPIFTLYVKMKLWYVIGIYSPSCRPMIVSPSFELELCFLIMNISQFFFKKNEESVFTMWHSLS